jgi:hypothetical protein
VAAKTPELPPVFESRKLGIALIATSVVWWILYTVLLFSPGNYHFLNISEGNPLGLLANVLIALSPIVLAIIGIGEIRLRKKNQTGAGMVGLADIALAISLLLFSRRTLFTWLDYFRGSDEPGFALEILCLITVAITVTLFILAFLNRKKAGQRATALRTAAVLFAVATIFSTLLLIVMAVGFGGVGHALIIIILAESALLAGLIARAVDLLPKRQRFVQTAGASAGGSTTTANPLDAPSGGFAVLCFFIPLVGLILYLVWKDEYPLKAKSCGKGALIGVIVIFGLSCLLTVLMVAIPLLMMF